MLAQPLILAYELTSFTGGVAALFGAAIALRNNRSIRSPASLLLVHGALKGLAPLQALVSCGLFSIVAYALFLQAVQSARINEVSSLSPIGIPLPPVRFAMAAAFALMALLSLSAFARAVVGKERSS